jgi:uncharacterized protein YbcI
MDVKEAELELAKRWSKLRKELAGKGPLDTQVRIAGEVMFVKCRTQYNDLEKLAIRHFEEHKESDHHQAWIESINQSLNQMLGDFISGLSSNHFVYHNLPDEGYTFSTLVLNQNLENNLRSGCYNKN